MYPTWTKRRTKKSIPCSIPLFYHFLPWFGCLKKLFHKNWCPQGGSQWFCSSEQPSHRSQLHRIGTCRFPWEKSWNLASLKSWGCHGSMVYFVYLQWHQFMVTKMMGKFGWRTCSLRNWQFFFWLKKIRPWWGICLIFILYWKDLIDFLKTILPPVSWFHITFPNGGLPGFWQHDATKTSRCRPFEGNSLKWWYSTTDNLPSVFGTKVRCFTISQLETPNQMQKISWCALPDPIDSCVSFPQDLQRCLSIWGAPGRGERENVENPLERNLKV